MESDVGSSASNQIILAPQSHSFATIMEPEPHSATITDRGPDVSRTIVGSNPRSSPDLLEPESPERPVRFWGETRNRQSGSETFTPSSATYTPHYTDTQPVDHDPNRPDEEGSEDDVSPVYEVLDSPEPQNRPEDSHNQLPLDANALAHNTDDIDNDVNNVSPVYQLPEPQGRSEDSHEMIDVPPLDANALAHNTDDVDNNVIPVYEVVDSPEPQNRHDDSHEVTNAPEVAESDTEIRIDVFRFNTDSNSSLFTIRPDRAVSIPMDTATQTQEVTNTSNNTATANEEVNDNSSSTFEQPESRKRENDGEDPPSKMLKRTKSDDTDGETCPICLDSWGTSGEHRLVALKCGHLFGASCVQRWLKGQLVKDRACPTCKRKCQLKDIRYIFAKKLVAVDTSQMTALQTQIDNLQAEKCRVELELQKLRIAHRACMLQLDVLRSTLMKSQVPKEPQVRKSWRFALEKNLEVCKDGGCRVLTYNCRTYELYVSQKSTNNLFPGYGIRKVSCVDYKLGQFMLLHPKAIRDITYSQPKDLLLSVGLDSTARIVERGILNVTVQSGVPLWSCSWDYLRGNEFYAGGVGGVIQQYDIRNPSSYIQRLQAPGDMSPVVSLCSTEFGLLSCQLNSCWLWVQNGSRQWEPRALPLDGPFMSLCYDNESHRALVSCRPGPNERSRLALCKLRTSIPSGEVLIDTESTFMGSNRSSLMSRATFVKAQSCSWVAAHSESDASLFLHGLDGVAMTRLPSAEPALDVASVQLNGDTLVAALSESRLRIYKAISTS